MTKGILLYYGGILGIGTGGVLAIILIIYHIKKRNKVILKIKNDEEQVRTEIKLLASGLEIEKDTDEELLDKEHVQSNNETMFLNTDNVENETVTL